MWDTFEPLPPLSKPKVFTPNITQTYFRTDTIRFTIIGNLQLIDAIGNYFLCTKSFEF
jgi:hypothetical protein